MKKTKILVPALGILALGMAASVTGTVAWFSTNTMVYADGIKVTTTAQDSLVISLTENGTYGSKVTHGWSTLTSIDPAYCLTDGTSGAVALAAAPQFKTLNAPLVTGNNPTYEVRENGKVYAISDGTLQDPDTNSTAFIAATTQVIDASEWLKINGTVEQGGKPVTAKITATRTTGMAIDSALRIGFWDGAKFEVASPFSGGPSAANTFNFLPTNPFAVGNDPVNVHIYVWYDGEDAACTNTNAAQNEIVINADYTYSARS